MQRYHDYINYQENPEMKVDVCRFCKKKLHSRKDKYGRLVDPDTYLREHLREFLQPWHEHYQYIYGDKI